MFVPDRLLVLLDAFNPDHRASGLLRVGLALLYAPGRHGRRATGHGRGSGRRADGDRALRVRGDHVRAVAGPRVRLAPMAPRHNGRAPCAGGYENQSYESIVSLSSHII